jgi:putative endonuclease
MYYVYFLKSKKNSFLYIGSCEDLTNRINLHNKGLVKSTKAYRPWKLVGYKEYNTRSEAVKNESFFKTGQQKALLKSRYQDE